MQNIRKISIKLFDTVASSCDWKSQDWAKEDGNAWGVKWKSNCVVTARLWLCLPCPLHSCLPASTETLSLSTHLLSFALSLPFKRHRFDWLCVPVSLGLPVAKSGAKMPAQRICLGNPLSLWGWCLTTMAAAVRWRRAICGGMKRDGLIGKTRFWRKLYLWLHTSGW